MQRMDLNAARDAKAEEASRLATLHELIERQIAGLEALFKANSAHVKDAASFNIVAGYIDQLKFWAPRPFYDLEVNADWFCKGEGAPVHPLLGTGD